MERMIINDLKAWKANPDRKPLILKGARQVGKTWILREFGRTEYRNCVYFNCDHNEEIAAIFAKDFNVQRILRSLSALSGESIKPQETLIILDEIQDVPYGLASLKYFCEDAREYHVAVAGSLLGIALHHDTSFPVGKVDILEMYPMTFREFLVANGGKSMSDLIEKHDWDVMAGLHQSLTDWLRQYYFVGGMPEAVETYVTTKDIWAVRKKQEEIIEAYRDDISKHAPERQVPRINMVLNSIPSQLARDNKKFIFGALKKGARADDFEIAIQWLVDAGVAYKIHRIQQPTLPLKFYVDLSAFKLFLLDCGLLGALSETPPSEIFVSDNAIREYKGAFTEDYVLQELKAMAHTFVYYFSNDKSSLEIDFIIQYENKILPIEVKAEENLRAKSLRVFTTHHPELHGIRISMSAYRPQDWMTNIPLYAVRAGIETVAGAE
jgi:predicted AAA+ superfamily ATPase